MKRMLRQECSYKWKCHCPPTVGRHNLFVVVPQTDQVILGYTGYTGGLLLLRGWGGSRQHTRMNRVQAAEDCFCRCIVIKRRISVFLLAPNGPTLHFTCLIMPSCCCLISDAKMAAFSENNIFLPGWNASYWAMHWKEPSDSNWGPYIVNILYLWW